MATALFYWLWGKISRALHREEKIEAEAVQKARFYRAQMAVFLAGLEGHIYLTYLYPITYPVIDMLSRSIGVDLSGIKYGGHH